MKRLSIYVIIFLLGYVASLVSSVLFSAKWKSQRSIERVTIPRLRMERQSLFQIASHLKSELWKGGLKTDILVDHSIADNVVDLFLVGEGNGIFWAHGVADVFECRLLVLDDGSLMFRQAAEK